MGQPNWANQTIWTKDNLDVMRGMNSACVDLIYLDPPFNSKANYAAPIGSQAAGAEFKDTWTLKDVDIAWLDLIEAKHKQLNRVISAAMTRSDKSYLIYMAVRLLEMHRILKPTGSIYLHCDPTMSHYLKLLMDAVFGGGSFRNEIIWKRTSSHNRAKRWGPVHDTILYYSLGNETRWNRVLEPLDSSYVERFYRHKDDRGCYRTDNLTGPGPRTGDTGKPWRRIDPTKKSRHWELPPDRALPEWFNYPNGFSEMLARERLDVLEDQGLIYWPKRGNMPAFKRYLGPKSGAPLTDVILDIPPLSAATQERLGYPTQKPLALINRIIKASSNESDVVLDPFCGCATACIASEKLQRQWVGIDVSPKAAELVRVRMRDEIGLFYNGAHRTDIPARTDLGKIEPYNNGHNKKHLYGEQGGSCNGCSEHFRPQNLTIDHIIPRAKGGQDHLTNLQLLCGYCNSVKGDRGMEYLIAKLAA